GQYHCFKGTLVEMIGHMTGAISWQMSGRNEYVAGMAEIQAAEVQPLQEAIITLLRVRFDSLVDVVRGYPPRQVKGAFSGNEVN
ncbi:hypothetical protein C8J57DRAFT_1067523, partial [Mycena rebaudengoi]